jgi:prenyltransferase beta subunit
MVVILWIVVFVVYGTFRAIPTVESYGAGVFCSGRTLIAVKLLRTISRQISFEFLFIKTCPPDKLHNRFGFVIQFRVGIRYLKCEGGEF